MNPPTAELAVIFQRFGVSLLLGFLIGMEREREKSATFAGVRTFPLIAVLGCLGAMLSEMGVPWMFPVAFIVVAAFVLASYRATFTPQSPGMTTEIAALLCCLYGALVWWDMAILAGALAVTTVLLLTTKEPLQALARRIGHADVIAAAQFGAITLIVLPILPNRTYGPLHVLNPHLIWIMVVLIAGLNLVGYALMKLRGSRQGIGLGGLLGGLVSSTALTLSFSRRSRDQADFAPLYALGIIMASAIMFVRILVIAATQSAVLARHLLVPLGAAAVIGLAGCLLMWFAQRRTAGPAQEQHVAIRNPCELWLAIRFGVLFGMILLISRAAQEFVGTVGIYWSSALSGLVDVDAITLSLSNLSQGTITTDVAARGITLAAVANTAVKAGIAALIGGPALRRATLPLFLAMTAAAAAIAFMF